MPKRTIDTIEIPDIGSTASAIIGDKIIFVSCDTDSDTENPVKDWSAMGHIYSLGRRHENFAPDKVRSAIEDNPDVVLLSYFEHGQCIWSVRGELPPGANCPWDSVDCAGVWVPDKDCLEECQLAAGSAERREWMQERARQVCEAYTSWCNGEVYYYNIYVFDLIRGKNGDPYDEIEDYRRETPIHQDSCGGYYGYDYFQSEAQGAVNSVMKDIKEDKL